MGSSLSPRGISWAVEVGGKYHFPDNSLTQSQDRAGCWPAAQRGRAGEGLRSFLHGPLHRLIEFSHQMAHEFHGEVFQETDSISL